MQMQIFRKAVLGLMALGLTLSALAILSCGGGDDNNTFTRQANLQGVNERLTPVLTTSGSGTAVLTINDDHTQISYTLTYTGLTNVLQAHIHVVNSPELAGPIILFLCTNIGVGTNVGIGGAQLPAPQACPQGSTVTVTGTLTSADLIPRDATPTSPAIATFADAIAQILNGNTYTNVHTQANPGGEIRGTDLPQ